MAPCPCGVDAAGNGVRRQQFADLRHLVQAAAVGPDVRFRGHRVGPWAALTPVVAMLASRLTLARGRRLRCVRTLAAAGLPIAVVKVMLTRVLREVAGGVDYFQISNITTQYLIYWAIVAVVHAAEYYRGERSRELRASQAETRLAEARLQLLRMQIHLHFLFNTLNMIAELVHENAAAAERMIGNLANYCVRLSMPVRSIQSR